MDLQRTYYPFAVQPGLELIVQVTGGDDVEYGSEDLPFTADGTLTAGQERQFDESFVLHFPGRTFFEINLARTEAAPATETAPDPVPVPDEQPPLPPEIEGDEEP